MIEPRSELNRDVEKEFIEPKFLIERQDISPEEKLSLLENWRADLLELQHATEENMPSANVRAGGTGHRLAQVAEAIAVVKKQLSNSPE